MSSIEKNSVAKKFRKKKIKESDASSIITDSSSFLVNKIPISNEKAPTTKNLLYLHYLKKLCELASCTSLSTHDLSPQVIKKTTEMVTPVANKRAKSVSNPSTKSIEESDNYATLLNTRKNSIRDKFWQNHKVKPIVKLAEDFEFYTDHEDDYKYDSLSIKQQKIEEINKKKFQLKHLNCFFKKNGSFTILVFRRVLYFVF